MHQHHREDDAYVVLDGEITFSLDGVERRLGPGGHVFLPRGVSHTFRVESETARVLEIVTPAGAERWHYECSDPAGADGFPPAGDIDVGRILATIAPYGIDIVGPPMS